MWACMGHTIPCTSTPPPKEAPANLSWVYSLLLNNSYLSKQWFGWAVIYPVITDSLCGEKPEPQVHPCRKVPPRLSSGKMQWQNFSLLARTSSSSASASSCSNPWQQGAEFPCRLKSKKTEDAFWEGLAVIPFLGSGSAFWLTQPGDNLCTDVYFPIKGLNLGTFFPQLSLQSGLSPKLLCFAPVSPILG